MADPLRPQATDHDRASELHQAEERGSLIIDERVVAKVARQAARSVPGVVNHSGMLGHVTGRDLPRIDSTVAGDRVRLGAQIAVGWPTPVSRAAADTRAAIARDVEHITGMNVDDVDVSVAQIVVGDSAASGRLIPVTRSAERSGSSGSPELSLSPGPAPRRTPAATVLGPVLAILLAVGGGFLVNDAAALARWTETTPVVTDWVRGLGEIVPQPWTTALGVLIALAGLLVLAVGLRSPGNKEIPVGDTGHLWIRPADVAKVATLVAQQVPGVISARSVAGTSAITIEGTSTADDTRELERQVCEAVTARLSAIGTPPSVRTRLRGVGGNR